MIRMGARIEKASDYCTFCPKLCRFACPAAQAEARETVTPWGLMSLLHMVRHGSVELSSEIGEAFFHCTGCLRCQTWCKHGNDVPEAMMAARRLMVDRGVAIPRALQGIDLNYEQFGSPHGDVPTLPEGTSEAFDPRANVAYVPEASRRTHAPETLAMVGRVLEVALGRKVALIEDLDGQPLHDSGELLRWTGHGAWSEMWQENMIKSLEDRTTIITESAGFAERWQRAGTVPRVVHLASVLVENAAALAEAARTAATTPLSGRSVVYHDSCGVGRRLGQYDGPRILVEALLGRPADELWLNRDKALCCGAGGTYPQIAPEASQRAARVLVEAVHDQGAEAIITPEQGCQYHLAASAGITVLDLVELAGLAIGA